MGAMTEREYSRFIAARLIMENQIMLIRPVVIRRTGNKGELSSPYCMEVFVSCFGVCLDSKVIVFNQGTVRLLAVEVGQSHIVITYGTDKEQYELMLLCNTLDQAAFEEVSRKFYYETGIMPHRGGMRIE